MEAQLHLAGPEQAAGSLALNLLSYFDPPPTARRGEMAHASGVNGRS
jgi:hypothetical protein